MPAYQIAYFDNNGALKHQFSANCDDDKRAKIIAHAMRVSGTKGMEVWSRGKLIYIRPDEISDRVHQRACDETDQTEQRSALAGSTLPLALYHIANPRRGDGAD